MGKYMKKSKTAGDVAVMEVSSSPIGVRTRAKTLALQNSDDDPSSFSYLQLRSRRLQKVLVVGGGGGARKQPPAVRRSDFGGAGVNSRLTDEKGSEVDENAECCFGDNVLELEGRDRSIRESTPCSLIRDSNAIDTPGSTTRQKTSNFASRIIQEHMQRNLPTTYEMEEFFACAEKQQQTIFMDRYNFDIVNDVPLPGRYEWVQVHH